MATNYLAMSHCVWPNFHEFPEFLKEMQKVAKECYRVLQPGKYCAILMGDIRKGGSVIPLGFKVMNLFANAGLN